MKTIEYEERVLISKNDYEKVIEDVQLSGKKLVHLSIENIYLDNGECFIKNNGWMLRIRTTNNGQKELTLKIKNPDNSAIEINETLENHKTIDNHIKGNLENYHEIAKLKTDRIEVKYDDYLLVIDRNEYHGIIDYDLEIESNNQEKSRKILENYCEKYHLMYDSNYQVKSARAIKRAEELNKKR